MPRRVNIATATEAINALGGTNKVAKLFGLSYRVVSNWHSRGLPPDTYYVLAPRLTARGCKFSPLLFAQKETRRRLAPNQSPSP